MKPTFLVVEDHDGVRTLLLDWLGENFPESLLREAKSGEEAVSSAVTEPPDIVLMDIGLPKMDGIQATRRIKTAVPQAQVVIVTSHEASRYQSAAIGAGASAYVMKSRIYIDLLPILTGLFSHPKETAVDPHHDITSGSGVKPQE